MGPRPPDKSKLHHANAPLVALRVAPVSFSGVCAAWDQLEDGGLPPPFLAARFPKAVSKQRRVSGMSSSSKDLEP